MYTVDTLSTLQTGIAGFTDSPLDSGVFRGICSSTAADELISAHFAAKPCLVNDVRLPSIDFGLQQFFELLRDRRWHGTNEIEFYADGRAGRAGEIWPKVIRPSGSLPLDSILYLQNNKISIYVKRVDLLVQSIRELAADISRTGYFKTTFSLMYSPAGALSTPNHIDTCDVLAVQLCGEKSWEVDCQQRSVNATPFQADPAPDAFSFISSNQYVTRAGEALYIPRGTLHNAMSTESESLHLVICLYPLTWFEVIQIKLQELCDNDPDMRASVLVNPGDGTASLNVGAVGEILSQLSTPAVLQSACLAAMKKRAIEHQLNNLGQMFVRSAGDLL